MERIKYTILLVFAPAFGVAPNITYANTLCLARLEDQLKSGAILAYLFPSNGLGGAATRFQRFLFLSRSWFSLTITHVGDMSQNKEHTTLKPIMPKIINVTAAILENDGRIIIAQRKSSDHLSGLWEFPGGKIEPGETPEECLARELKEEFDIDVEVGEFLGSTVHHYDHISIELMAYQAAWTGGTISMNGHKAYRWVTVDELVNYDFAPADVPFVDMLRSGKLTFQHNLTDSGNSRLDAVVKRIIEFRDERDWSQFHSPKNLAEAINIEASELLEIFLWMTTEQSKELGEIEIQNVKNEVADIFIFLTYLCHHFGIDLLDAVNKKIELNSKKYPISKSKGSSKKYSEL